MPPKLARFLKDLDGVAALRGVDGKVHAGGAAADDADLLRRYSGRGLLG